MPSSDGHLPSKTPFVTPGSIVRTIWGDADTILFVFAGSAAEFALNRAVDWLFYTGKLPADPLGRLFSTAGSPRTSPSSTRPRPAAASTASGPPIWPWSGAGVRPSPPGTPGRALHAHRLLGAGLQLLHRPLTGPERADLYDVFRRIGEGLSIPELPETYDAWREDRRLHIERDLGYSDLTAELYGRYRRHLGWWRYETLLRVQSILVPDHCVGCWPWSPAAGYGPP